MLSFVFPPNEENAIIQFLQVVGHTPMETITKKKNVISCDVFSTYRDGKPIGTEEFLLLDTITWDYSMVNYGNY